MKTIYNQQVCANCGRMQDHWQDYATDANDQGYCCRGCAEDHLCTCDSPFLDARGRVLSLNFEH